MSFGGSGITKELFDYIVSLPDVKTVLELVAGHVSTKFLSGRYNLYSVEDKPEYIGLYRSTYIHAPLVNGWYSTEVLKNNLPPQYDLILVDGPTGEGNRIGFAQNLLLFNTDVTMIFDDTNRKGELDLLQRVAGLVNRPYVLSETFGVIPRKQS